MSKNESSTETAKSPVKSKARKSLLRRVLKFILVALLVLFLAGLGGLFLISFHFSGHPDRAAHLLSQNEDIRYVIKKDFRINFFPYIHIESGGIIGYAKTEDSQTQQNPVVQIEHLEVGVGWSFLFSARPWVYALNVSDLYLAPDLTGGFPFRIETLGTTDNPRRLVGNGQLGRHPWTLDGELENRGRKFRVDVDKGLNFSAEPGARFTVKKENATISFDGKIESLAPFSDLVARGGLPDWPCEAEFTFSSPKEDNLHINIRNLLLGRSQIRGNLSLHSAPEQSRIAGALKAETLDIAEVGAIASAIPEKAMKDLLDDPRPVTALGLDKLMVDIDLDIKNVTVGEKRLGFLKARIHSPDGTFFIDPVEGEIWNGDFKASASLHSDANPPGYNTSIHLKSLDMQKLGGAFSGQADFNLNLSGTGAYFSDMLKSTDGDITLNARNGTFETDTLNLMTGGVLGRLVPAPESEKRTLNCLVANFRVKSGVAESQAILIDGERAAIRGEGSANLHEGTMDLRFVPYPKQPALLDLSSPVIVRGPLAKPEIYPAPAALIGKIGSTLLGVANPVLFALPLTSLGLESGHPCAEFFEKSGEAKEGSQEGSQDEARGEGQKDKNSEQP